MTPATTKTTPLSAALDGRPVAWLATRLTDLTGVEHSRQRVWTWVTGQHRPDETTRRLVAQILGRSTAEIFPPKLQPCVVCGELSANRWCSTSCHVAEDGPPA